MQEKIKYNDYLEEQPYYYIGITEDEARIEEEYLSFSYDEFLTGEYIPLWKQKLNSKFNNYKEL